MSINSKLNNNKRNKMGESKGLKYSMKDLNEAYARGENIIQLLKRGNSDSYNSAHKMKFIEIAYDLQSGSYIEAMKDPEHAKNKRSKCAEMAEIVSKFHPNPTALLKAGVGEAVTLAPFLDSFNGQIKFIEGFDISWSRVSYAKQFLRENGYDNVKLCTGTLQSIPYVDNAFDLIMTSHAVEPNGGFEEEILSELKRVSSNIVALFEPSFEMATEKGKARMISHGYVQKLPEIAQDLGFKILYNQALKSTMNINNPTAALILQTPTVSIPSKQPSYACPISKKRLTPYDKGLFSKESFRYYPTINAIPTLRKKNGILASSIKDKI